MLDSLNKKLALIISLALTTVLTSSTQAHAEANYVVGFRYEICAGPRHEVTAFEDADLKQPSTIIKRVSVKKYQGFGLAEQMYTVRGFERVQLLDGFKNKLVWVKSTEIVTAGQCDVSSFNLTPMMDDWVRRVFDEEDEGDDHGQGAAPVSSLIPAQIESAFRAKEGLNSPNCCGFPLTHSTTSFLSGRGHFGAGRRGRIHAGADLYGQRNEDVLAVTDGVVTRGPYYFYGGTYALDVLHAGGFVVRYGEVTGKSVQAGHVMKRGEKIAHMGKVSCCEPMVHFELYTGKKEGGLTQRVNRYERRADVIDPTTYLQKWAVPARAPKRKK